MEVTMLTEKDIKIIGAFVYCLKKSVESAATPANHRYSSENDDASCVTIPFKLTGLIDGFVLVVLPVEIVTPSEAAALNREQRLARLISGEVMRECAHTEFLNYQSMTSAIMVNRDELLHRLRHSSYCVKFEMRLHCGKIELYASSIDRKFRKPVPEEQGGCVPGPPAKTTASSPCIPSWPS